MRSILIVLFFWGASAFAIDGEIVTDGVINLNVAKGEKSFGPGKFAASVERTRKGQIKLEVSLAGNNNNPQAFFNVPAGKSVPRENGTLALSAAESGQPYDLKGFWDTQISERPLHWTKETCRYLAHDTICSPTHCEVRDRWVYGWRDVSYFDRIYDLAVVVSLRTPGGTESVADFGAQTSSVERVYRHQGICQ